MQNRDKVWEGAEDANQLEMEHISDKMGIWMQISAWILGSLAPIARHCFELDNMKLKFNHGMCIHILFINRCLEFMKFLG